MKENKKQQKQNTNQNCTVCWGFSIKLIASADC